MNNQPRFSIITCTKDSAAYLRENLRSVSTQTFGDYEHIFIDALSKDGTKEIITAYAEQNPEKVRVMNKPPSGISAAMNEGIRQARGQYLIHLHSDDRFHDDKVLEDVDKFLKEKPLDWIFGMENLVNPNRQSIGLKSKSWLARTKSDFLGRIIVTYFHVVRHQTVFIKKEVFEKFGYFDEKIKCPMDLDMWLRIKDKTSWSHISRVISDFMVRNDSVSFSTGQNGQAFEETYLVYHRHLTTRQKVLKLFIETAFSIIFTPGETWWKYHGIRTAFFK